MSKSARRPQQVYGIVMWALSVVFAGFLIGLGGLIIKDLPRVDRTITVEDYVPQADLAALDTRTQQITREIQSLRREVEDDRSTLMAAQNDYRTAEVTFENWLATRSATESTAQNPEVLRRTRAVEALKTAERTASRDLEQTQNDLRAAERTQSDLNSERRAMVAGAQPAFKSARRIQELRVFGFRLMLTLPLLVIGGWLLIRKRGSSYWPLYRGFVLFALFAFFVELVPYLPWYGGYIRYTVGIILIVIAGHFIIRGMRRYLERKRKEETRSESERRQSIEYETALKKIAAKTCPGCDRSIVTRDGVNTEFCVHCGIRLERPCESCGERNISFYKFCLSCGDPQQDPATQTA